MHRLLKVEANPSRAYIRLEMTTMMQVLSLCFLQLLLALPQRTAPASEFQLEGDYLMGGLFDIHNVIAPVFYDEPEAISCPSQHFIPSSYRRFQLMRFSVEEINNSTSLLPNVSLGYEIFNHCSDTHNFPGLLNLLSVNDSIQPWSDPSRNQSKISKVIAVVGPFSSTDTMTVAPLYMADLIPLVSYGAASSAFSEKAKFPSFLRTVFSNKDVIEVIVSIIQHFNWRWVAFLRSDNDFGNDGLDMFIKRIKDTEICLAYTKGLDYKTDYSKMFQQIEAQRIRIIIVFVTKLTAEALIMSSIQLNITNKVWIAGDTWSLNKKLPNEKGIRNIGTVLGVSQPVVSIPGFSDFIYSTKSQTQCEDAEQNGFCNQACNCSDLSAEDVIALDPSYSFPVYSAVYAIAHALHNALQCGVDSCNGNITVHPHMVLAELKKVNFTLLNQSIQFDEHGDPTFGSYSIVFWNSDGEAEEIGFFKFQPSVNYVINDSKIQWYTNGELPTALCSQECLDGYAKKQNGIHKCCFNCDICPNGTYINITEDPYKCIRCKETEWSAEGSTSCNLRSVEYVPFTDSSAILIMFGSVALEGLTLAVSALFAINYNTPVVRSAGGLMCFLILGCLTLCSLSVFFYFASEFQLDGDYLIGGLFDIHHASTTSYRDRPEAINCSSQSFLLPNYRRFQLMRFSVEEINNSTSLLPDISLGYEMFDHCSNTQNYPGIFHLISANGLIQPWGEPKKHANASDVSKVIAVVGPFTSTQALTAAPWFMADFIPTVSYGSSSSVFSAKAIFPSFLRTVHPNKAVIEVIVNILLHFNWRWVAFLNSDDDFGNDGLEMFRKRIKDTEICLAYTKGLTNNPIYPQIFKQIEVQRINTIIVFAPKLTVEALIMSAIQLNITQKVWIADDGWSLNKRLPKEEGIRNIGTVLGVSQPVITIPGFNDFIYSTNSKTHCDIPKQNMFCNRICKYRNLIAEEILSADPSFSFAVYSAVYAIAHALHNTLQCGADHCNRNITVYPHLVLQELMKSHFTLLNQDVMFDVNGDPKFGPLSIVFWNHSGDAEEVGFYHFQPSVNFFINNSKIKWNTNGEVPTSLCSKECSVGYMKEQNGIQQCCFTCKICPDGTYINSTEDPYKCIRCKETEWSAEGSTSCHLRSVEYIPFTDSGAILIMFGSVALEGLTLAMSALFAINYNTPVVRSAGGLMCFLILGCLSLCSLSVFFYFGSEFQLDGDFLIGGLFDIHHVSVPGYHDRPEATECSSKPILLPNYRRFQLMRFSIEQINNSSSLLPDISLGYEMFDHCSDTQNFPGIFNLISVNRLILPWAEPHKQQTNDSDVSKVIAVVGPYTSTKALTVAPLFMTDLIPMVNYGSSSSVFSEKAKFPSFLRTVHPNKDIMEVIVSILLHFNWHWVTFLYSDDDYGNDGVATFRKMIKDTKICLAYSKGVNDNTSYYQIFNQIEALKIHVIVVFAPKLPAEALIMSAIQLNFTQKVWIAGDAWSLNERLPKEEGIQNIGTVLGVSQPVVTIPGFSDFIYSTKCQTSSENLQKPRFCNQVFNCSSYSAEEILSVDPSFSFPVYSAVYAIAHALHNTLQCGDGQCNGNSTVYPHMVLAELKKSNFTLLNQSIEFDEHGDPKYGSYSFVFWNHSGDAEEIGFYKFHPSINFFINDSKIQWFTNGEVPTSLCSKECTEGYVKEQNGIHQCCFTCKICANGTYINSTVCLACFVVRSFQIVSIFKMAAKFPKLYSWWMKYHGQWLIITVAFVTQTFSLLVVYSCSPPKPYNETVWNPKEIILSCESIFLPFSGSAILIVFLGSLCFIFSYMGKDLPKNYNEAKAITFCLLLLILTWIIFATIQVLYRGKYNQILSALAVLSSLYSFLLWYFFPKCYIIIFQPQKNTQQYFQDDVIVVDDHPVEDNVPDVIVVLDDIPGDIVPIYISSSDDDSDDDVVVVLAGGDEGNDLNEVVDLEDSDNSEETDFSDDGDSDDGDTDDSDDWDSDVTQIDDWPGSDSEDSGYGSMSEEEEEVVRPDSPLDQELPPDDFWLGWRQLSPPVPADLPVPAGLPVDPPASPPAGHPAGHPAGPPGAQSSVH
ncbi:Taste receptor type 1 member 1%2C partial [Xyrichtys novacula]|uniref:Taste receptor type 1 member 1, partial n=1 Tax=Xyrichtys novacula TaxID=13765 RepID=A0AAV1HHY8_XYRNO|nr:Taste receptor type 1 member 1%2C partial [Xyrichtys novacula]